MPKPRALGADAHLLGCFETTYGTPPGTGYRKLPFFSSDLGEEQPLGYDPLLGQGRNAGDAYYDQITDQGTIAVPLDLRNIGWWLKLLFGAPNTTGAGPYSHEFISGGDLSSAALEIGHPKLTSPAFFMNAGVKADTFSFPMQRGGRARADIGLIAQGETKGGTTIDSTPDEYEFVGFSNGSGEIRVGGVLIGNITGGQFNFSNNLDPVATIRADGKIDGADEGEATLTGSVTVRFANASAIETPISDKTPVAMSYQFSIPGGAGHLLKFEMPRVFLPKKKAPITGPKGIEMTYDWQASGADGAGPFVVKATLVNDVATYA